MSEKTSGSISSAQNAICLRLIHRLKSGGRNTHFGFINYPDVFLSVAIWFILTLPAYASVAGDVNHANHLYKQGKYEDAVKLYQQALAHDNNVPVINYNLGTALYKKGDYSQAQPYLEKAAEDKNVQIQHLAHYNLGNALYKSGMQKKDADVDAAIASLKSALQDYRKAIAEAPKDQDAGYNEGIVKKEIERLKKEKQQQQQQKQSKQKNKKNSSQQKQSKNSQSQQGAQKKKNQEQQQQEQRNKEQQKKQQSQDKQKSSAEQNKPQPSGQKQQNAQPQGQAAQQKVDQQQAKEMLEDYQRNEEPKQLLNFIPKKTSDQKVEKDW